MPFPPCWTPDETLLARSARYFAPPFTVAFTSSVMIPNGRNAQRHVQSPSQRRLRPCYMRQDPGVFVRPPATYSIATSAEKLLLLTSGVDSCTSGGP